MDKSESKTQVIKKRRGDKEETTQILTVEVKGKTPETILTIEEQPLKELKVVQPITIDEELPKQVKQTTVVQKGDEKKVKKEKNNQNYYQTRPEVTVTSEEVDSITELPEKPFYVILNLPMEIQDTVVIDEGVAKKRVQKNSLQRERWRTEGN